MSAFSTRTSVMESIRELRLKKFDWDGSGGLPMRDDAGDVAIDFFDSVSVTEIASFNSLPLPDVSLASNGTIAVEFGDADGKQLFLTFQCAGVITYLKVFDDGQTTVEGTIRFDELYDSPDDFVELLELFSWFVDSE